MQYLNKPILSIAGIGSRDAPVEDLLLAERLGYLIAKMGIQVTSGSAPGMDTAFEKGVLLAMEENPQLKQSLLMSFIPWQGFEKRRHDDKSYFLPTKEMFDVAKVVLLKAGVVWFPKLGQGIQKLYMRNVFQVLRIDLTKVDLVIYSAKVNKRGKPTGGTAIAIMVADWFNIPSLNMSVQVEREILKALFLGDQSKQT